MGEARFVRQDDIAVRAVTKKSDDGGMSARSDFFDAALEAAIGMTPRDAGENTVAVHGVAHGVGADEEVAVHAGNGLVGNDEAVAVAVGYEAASD